MSTKKTATKRPPRTRPARKPAPAKKAPTRSRKTKTPEPAAQPDGPRAADGGMPIVYVRTSPALKAWLDSLTARFGVRPADVMRGILEDARIDDWDPVKSMARRAERTTFADAAQ